MESEENIQCVEAVIRMKLKMMRGKIVQFYFIYFLHYNQRNLTNISYYDKPELVVHIFNRKFLVLYWYKFQFCVIPDKSVVVSEILEGPLWPRCIILALDMFKKIFLLNDFTGLSSGKKYACLSHESNNGFYSYFHF